MNLISEKFGGKVRIRVNGLIFKDNSILLIEHNHLGPAGKLWAPPGGGLEFGESLLEALRREVKEECGLEVIKAEYQFINEFIAPPLHAIEVFYNITEYKGSISKGSDPEMDDNQIIKSVKFVTFEDLSIMKDEIKHNILKGQISKERIKSLNGTIQFKSNR